MLRKNQTLRVAAASVVAFTAVADAQYTWKPNTVGSWSVGSNWTGNVPPPNGAIVLNFSATAGGVFNANQNIASPFSTWIVGMTTVSSGTSTLSGLPILFNPYDLGGTITGPQIQLAAPAAGSFNGSVLISNEIQSTGSLSIYNSSTGTLTLAGNYTGPGALTTYGRNINLTANNTAANGLRVFQGSTFVRGSGILAGPVSVGGNTSIPNSIFPALLTLGSSSNVSGSDARVRVFDDGVINFDNIVSTNLARISPLSQGVVGLTEQQTVNFQVPLAALPLMSIGTAIPTSRGSASIQAFVTGAGGRIAFGGQLGDDTSLFGSDRLTVTSPLTQALGASSVVIGATALSGGKVVIAATANNYLGGTTVLPDRANGTTALTFNYTPTAGQTPLGSGSVVVGGTLLFEGTLGAVGALPNTITFRPGSALVFNNIEQVGTNTYSSSVVDRWGDTKPIALNGTLLDLKSFSSATETVGAVSLTGGSKFRISSYSSSDGIGTIDVAALTRTDDFATLTLEDGVNTSKIFKVRNASTIVTNALVHPSIVKEAPSGFFHPGEFLTVNASNLLVPFAYAGTFSTAVSDEVVATGSPTTIAVSDTARAWRMFGTATLSSGVSLNLKALSANDSATITGGTLTFSNNAFVFVNTNGTANITSSFRATEAITKFGPGALNLNGTGVLNYRIAVNEGTLGIGSLISGGFSTPTPITIGANAGLDFYGSQTFGAVTGELNAGVGVRTDANVTVASLAVDRLSIFANGRINLAPQTLAAGSGVASIRRFVVAPAAAPTGKFDITNNTVLLNYSGSTPAADIRRYLASGYAGGTQTGGGILTSSAGATVGYAEATDLFTTFPASYLGQSLDPSTIIIRSTLNGDANLDRQVNSLDFNRLATSYGFAAGTWFAGDFNYDNAVDTRDFALLVAGFGKTFPIAGSLPEPSPGAAVPEPAAVTLLALGACVIRPRRSASRQSAR